MIFETDLDYGILESLSEEELFKYIEDNFVSPNTTYADGFSFKKTCNVMKILCHKVLKIYPSPEQWVFLLADCERLLCEACAGAGKTTMAQLRSIKEKLVHNVAGANILALAYNNHAVEDMQARHESIIRSINNLKIPELHRDRNICCHTFHSFCKSWVEDYIAEFGITAKTDYLLSETQRHEGMQLAITSYIKKSGKNIFSSDKIIDALLSLYSYTYETLTRMNCEAWKMCPSISDLSEITCEDISGILAMYTKWKTLRHKMDFTDLVEHMYELCRRPEVMKRIRANYKVFILDEYQDFTPSMLRVVKLIMEGDESLGIEPFEGSRMTCIGDGDQSIYGFRGTDPDNCVRFKDMFSSPGMLNRVTAMSVNRRCPTEVLDYAKLVIESNTRRINKPVRAIKTGGRVDVFSYVSTTDEMDNLIQQLKKIPANEYRDTCVCYRNQSSSYLLGLKLVQEGIQFKIGKGHLPMTDILSKSLFDVLNMLSYPDILSWADKALYKVLPKSSSFTRKTISEVIQLGVNAGKATGVSKAFYDLDFPDAATHLAGFGEALDTLRRSRQLHKLNKPMSTYMPGIIALIRKYYLDWQLSKSKQFTDDYLQYISKWFSQDKDYDTFIGEYRALLSSMDDTNRDKITITTMHGLKGLEFRNMFIIDLNDSIFPGTELNQASNLSNVQKDVLECEARRLFYVALTRSKQNLTLYFDSKVPSRYIRFFQANTGLADNYKQYIEADGYLLADGDTQDPASNTASSQEQDLLGLDLSGLEDLSSLDTLGGLDNLAEDIGSTNPIETAFSEASALTDIFSRLEAEAEEKEKTLVSALGEDNFNQIKNKPVISSILTRMCREGEK